MSLTEETWKRMLYHRVTRPRPAADSELTPSASSEFASGGCAPSTGSVDGGGGGGTLRFADGACVLPDGRAMPGDGRLSSNRRSNRPPAENPAGPSDRRYQVAAGDDVDALQQLCGYELLSQQDPFTPALSQQFPLLIDLNSVYYRICEVLRAKALRRQAVEERENQRRCREMPSVNNVNNANHQQGDASGDGGQVPPTGAADTDALPPMFECFDDVIGGFLCFFGGLHRKAALARYRLILVLGADFSPTNDRQESAERLDSTQEKSSSIPTTPADAPQPWDVHVTYTQVYQIALAFCRVYSESTAAVGKDTASLYVNNAWCFGHRWPLRSRQSSPDDDAAESAASKISLVNPTCPSAPSTNATVLSSVESFIACYCVNNSYDTTFQAGVWRFAIPCYSLSPSRLLLATQRRDSANGEPHRKNNNNNNNNVYQYQSLDFFLTGGVRRSAQFALNDSAPAPASSVSTTALDGPFCNSADDPTAMVATDMRDSLINLFDVVLYEYYRYSYCPAVSAAAAAAAAAAATVEATRTATSATTTQDAAGSVDLMSEVLEAVMPSSSPARVVDLSSLAYMTCGFNVARQITSCLCFMQSANPGNTGTTTSSSDAGDGAQGTGAQEEGEGKTGEEEEEDDEDEYSLVVLPSQVPLLYALLLAAEEDWRDSPHSRNGVNSAMTDRSKQRARERGVRFSLECRFILFAADTVALLNTCGWQTSEVFIREWWVLLRDLKHDLDAVTAAAAVGAPAGASATSAAVTSPSRLDWLTLLLRVKRQCTCRLGDASMLGAPQLGIPVGFEPAKAKGRLPEVGYTLLPQALSLQRLTPTAVSAVSGGACVFSASASPEEVVYRILRASPDYRDGLVSFLHIPNRLRRRNGHSDDVGARVAALFDWLHFACTPIRWLCATYFLVIALFETEKRLLGGKSIKVAPVVASASSPALAFMDTRSASVTRHAQVLSHVADSPEAISAANVLSAASVFRGGDEAQRSGVENEKQEAKGEKEEEDESFRFARAVAACLDDPNAAKAAAAHSSAPNAPNMLDVLRTHLGIWRSSPAPSSVASPPDGSPTDASEETQQDRAGEAVSCVDPALHALLRLHDGRVPLAFLASFNDHSVCLALRLLLPTPPADGPHTPAYSLVPLVTEAQRRLLLNRSGGLAPGAAGVALALLLLRRAHLLPSMSAARRLFFWWQLLMTELVPEKQGLQASVGEVRRRRAAALQAITTAVARANASAGAAQGQEQQQLQTPPPPLEVGRVLECLRVPAHHVLLLHAALRYLALAHGLSCGFARDDDDYDGGGGGGGGGGGDVPSLETVLRRGSGGFTGLPSTSAVPLPLSPEPHDRALLNASALLELLPPPPERYRRLSGLAPGGSGSATVSGLDPSWTANNATSNCKTPATVDNDGEGATAMKPRLYHTFYELLEDPRFVRAPCTADFAPQPANATPSGKAEADGGELSLDLCLRLVATRALRKTEESWRKLHDYVLAELSSV